MQIANARTSFASQQDMAGTQSLPSTSGSRSVDRTSSSAGVTGPTQDAAVNISAEGSAAVARERAAAQRSASSPAKTDSSTIRSTSAAQADAADALHAPTDPSAVKSFTYGTLGLERPDQPEEASNRYYSAGRWLAAGVTVWGIIALLA